MIVYLYKLTTVNRNPRFIGTKMTGPEEFRLTRVYCIILTRRLKGVGDLSWKFLLRVIIKLLPEPRMTSNLIITSKHYFISIYLENFYLKFYLEFSSEIVMLLKDILWSLQNNLMENVLFFAWRCWNLWSFVTYIMQFLQNK